MAGADVAAVAGCARGPDREEMLACSGLSVEQALAIGLERSLRAWVIESHGMPLAAVGDTIHGIGVGVPWMVTTEHIADDPRGFLRASKAVLAEILQRHQVLVNYVDARNVAAIRWLAWLGFEIGDPVPYGLHRLPFRQFTMIRGN